MEDKYLKDINKQNNLIDNVTGIAFLIGIIIGIVIGSGLHDFLFHSLVK